MRFTPSAPLQNEELMISITTELEDLSGNNLKNEFSQSFTYTGTDSVIYDRVPPEIQSIRLISNSFYIELSEEIEQSSVQDSIELKTSSGTISGEMNLDNSKTIKFTPSISLSRNSQYTITVKGTVKDLSGKPLSESLTKEFTYQGSDLLIFQKPDPNQRKESSVGNTTLFHGREYDPETGLYYFRARYYHPELGRFLSSDPNGYEDSLNPNQSFLNNPINFTDPYGAQVVEVTPKGARFKAERGLTFEEGYLMWISAEGLSREEVVSGKISGSRRRGILRRMGLSSEEIIEVERRVRRQELTVEFIDRPGGKPLILDEKAKNPTKVYNAIAKVVLNRDIRLGEFDARTLPDDSSRYATIEAGEFIGIPKMHKKEYPAIRLKKLEDGKLRDEIPTVGVNPAHPFHIYRIYISYYLHFNFVQGYATTINIHRAGRKDITISPPRKKPISEGCLLIRTSQWDEFSKVVNMVYGIGKAKIRVNTSENIWNLISIWELQK
jgi:RHS repeat-associated protein